MDDTGQPIYREGGDDVGRAGGTGEEGTGGSTDPGLMDPSVTEPDMSGQGLDDPVDL